jgi:signal transduction histidine kinase
VLDYFAMTSHELRTPLHGILGHADLLRSELAPGSARESSEAIIESGRNLLELLDQVLAVARIDLMKSGKDAAQSPHLVLLDVAAAIAEVARSMSGAARGRGLALECAASADCFALADPQTLRQALQNLVDNAIKFTDAGSVRIEAAGSSADQCRITVTDTGKGMSPTEQRGLFGIFEMRQPALAGQFQGSGLGLYLTRKTIMAMGGKVGFWSESGKGSTFWIELPAALPKAAGSPDASDHAAASKAVVTTTRTAHP